MQTAINIIIVFTVLVVIAALIFVVYYKKQEKERAEGKRTNSNTVSKASEKKVSALKDTRDYIREIEDIREGIIITDDATRFIAALNCRGVGDFYDQSASEQMGVMKGYLGFINTLTTPVTYRLFTKELDMDYTIKKYSDKQEEFIQKYKFLEASLAGISKERTGERERVLRDMENIKFKIEHLDSQMRAIEHFSSSVVAMEQVQNYIIEWKYRAADFDTDLTPAERFVRAKSELEVIASSKIAALSSAGVKARVCTQGEMIDMCRRVSQPISVERFRMKELDNSSFFDDINTSDSIKSMDILVGQEFAAAVEKDLQDLLFFGETDTESPQETEEPVTEDKEDGKEVFLFGEEE